MKANKVLEQKIVYSRLVAYKFNIWQLYLISLYLLIWLIVCVSWAVPNDISFAPPSENFNILNQTWFFVFITWGIPFLLILIPSIIFNIYAKHFLTNVKSCLGFTIFGLFCLPLTFVGAIFMLIFRLGNNEQLSSRSNGFLSNVFTKKTVFSSFFGNLAGAFKSKKKIQEEVKKNKEAQKVIYPKTSLLVMVPVLFKNKNSFKIQRFPIPKDNHEISSSIATEDQSKRRLKEELKKVRSYTSRTIPQQTTNNSNTIQPAQNGFQESNDIPFKKVTWAQRRAEKKAFKQQQKDLNNQNSLNEQSYISSFHSASQYSTKADLKAAKAQAKLERQQQKEMSKMQKHKSIRGF